MRLSSLFKEFNNSDVEFKGLSTNSKTTKPGDLFICIKGANIDRHDYIDEAIKNGAVALITAKDIDINIPYVKVDNPNNQLDYIYSCFYDNPLDKLKIIGVTGTDGKTSTTTIIQTLIGSDKCGYIGTNGAACKNFKYETNNTTPGKEELYYILDKFVKANVKYVSMETSSEAFFYKRLNNINFVSGSITNITSEHLNTHKTLENYIECKKELFKQSKICILNSNDEHFNNIAKDLDSYYTYGYNTNDDLYIKKYELLNDQTKIDFIYENNKYSIVSPLLGKFNVENLACALLTCLKNGFNIYELLKNISLLSVEGRMYFVDEGQDYYVLVDYAHTPNGLNRLFEYTNKMDVNKRIVVTGNAGGRDASKRKNVGKNCLDNNDHVIFCYEDPRFEDPKDIINDMLELSKDKNNYEIIIDRKQAIQKAINLASKNDLVMILGKGNENYQIIKDKEIPFNDIDEARIAIKNKSSQ